MGLIKAFGGAVRTTLADQWKEFIYCDAMDMNVLMQRARRKLETRAPTPSAARISFRTARKSR